MEQEKKQLSGRQKKKLFSTFLIAAGVTFVVCAVMMIAGVIIYNTTLKSGSRSQINNELTEEEKIFEEEKEEIGELNKTIAVFGMDEEQTRTDVIFVINFNTMTNKIKVVSIPRDTKVIWTDKQNRALQQYNGTTRYESKINEMSAYGGVYKNPGNIRDFTIDEIENILGIKVDNYVLINLEAFRAIVDAVGGVDLYVPTDMKYKDASQGLYIDLKEGMQHLDSDKAEQLVRFRGYKLGDSARVDVQQIFLKALAEKVKSQSLTELAGIATKMFGYVKTDVSLSEVLGYLDLLTVFDLNNLSFHKIPGYGIQNENPSYYHIKEDELKEMINEVFLDTTVAGEEHTSDVTSNSEETEEVVVDTKVSVAIYNATKTKGVAGRYKDKLQEKGYDIKKIDNYEENDLTDSIIYAKEKEKGAQFISLIPGAEVVEDASIEYDIEIVIGSESVNSGNE